VTNNSPVLGNSRISAVNWTDSNNVEFNAVFWQAKTADLMMSLWDAKGNSWSQVNITEKMGVTSADITAKKGTPLAATVRGYPWTASSLKNVGGDFGIALFYLSPQNTILELYSTDPRGASWKLGDLITSASNKIKTAPNSQLGVWWSLCQFNCSGTIVLAYEDDNQALRIANSSNWGTNSIMRNIADGSSLAFTAIPGNGGNNGPWANSARLYYDSSNKLSELMWTPPGPWYYGLFPLLSLSPRLYCPDLLTPLFQRRLRPSKWRPKHRSPNLRCRLRQPERPRRGPHQHLRGGRPLQRQRARGVLGQQHVAQRHGAAAPGQGVHQLLRRVRDRERAAQGLYPD
jgi:hypothetical protein